MGRWMVGGRQYCGMVDGGKLDGGCWILVWLLVGRWMVGVGWWDGGSCMVYSGWCMVYGAWWILDGGKVDGGLWMVGGALWMADGVSLLRRTRQTPNCAKWLLYCSNKLFYNFIKSMYPYMIGLIRD